MANTITGSGAGFIFWLFAARFYPEDAVGLASAIISAMGLLLLFSGMGFDIGIIAYLSEEKEKSRLINSCLTILSILSIIFASVFILGIKVWSPALEILRKTTYLVPFLIFAIAIPLLSFQGSVFVALRNTKYTFIQNLTALSRLIILPSLIVLGALGIYVSYGSGLIAALIIGNILIKRVCPGYKLALTIDRRKIKKILRFSFGSYLANVFAWLPNFALPLLVVNILGTKMNAYFYITWGISQMLLVMPRAVSKSLFAETSYDPKKLKINITKTVKFLFLPLILLTISILFFGDFILSLYGGAYSKNAFELLQLLAFASIPYSLNVLYIAIKRARKEATPTIYINGFIALFTISVGYLLLQHMGIIGIGVAWMLGNGFASVAVGLKVVKNLVLKPREQLN